MNLKIEDRLVRMTNRISRLNLIRWLIIALIAIPVGFIYWRHSDPRGASTYFDFEKGYYAAAKALLQGGASALKPHFSDMSFVNVPIVAWVLAPIGHLNQQSADIAFGALNVVCTLLAIFLLTRQATVRVATGLCFMFMLNGPIWNALKLGNSTQIVLLCLVAALALWRRQNGFLVGLLIGIAAVIKPMLILFGLYFALKRQWTVVLGGATVILAALLGSVAIAGVDTTVYWYQHIVADYAGKPMPAYNVQSIEAFILRLSQGPETITTWHPFVLPFWGGIARDVVFLALFGLVGCALWIGSSRASPPSSREPSPQDYLEFSIVLAFCIVTSTVSWTHYYLLLLIPYALYFTGRLPLKDDRLTRTLIWTSLIFCSLPVNRYGFGSKGLETLFHKSLASIWLIGGLLLFWALIRGALFSRGAAIIQLPGSARLERLAANFRRQPFRQPE
ncbi:MAG TPA: glycosyltransferase family 87 protein [Acidisoma sp.]|uniref:glycosyltransferase family 87 protein n=1 Tax=Acidisoma sp. TaxID=1872115 RepID=UPI002B5D714F|nr:glycosyltransferase family 87 protein [Acidisoma sp.]HTI01921.1 glycosyltransferase family 87 protein [Acidisoma sp.]